MRRKDGRIEIANPFSALTADRSVANQTSLWENARHLRKTPMSDSDTATSRPKRTSRPYTRSPVRIRLFWRRRRHHKRITTSPFWSSNSRLLRALALTKRNNHTTVGSAGVGLFGDRLTWRRPVGTKGISQLQTAFVSRPPLVSVRGHENGGVVNDGAHAGHDRSRRRTALVLRDLILLRGEGPCLCFPQGYAAKPAAAAALRAPRWSSMLDAHPVRRLPQDVSECQVNSDRKLR